MNKTRKTPLIEPDEMRMPAEDFEEIMRLAMGAPPADAPPEPKPRPVTPRRRKSKGEPDDASRGKGSHQGN